MYIVYTIIHTQSIKLITNCIDYNFSRIFQPVTIMMRKSGPSS